MGLNSDGSTCEPSEAVPHGEPVRAHEEMRPIDALVFDLDGVLVDSEQRLRRVWLATYERYGARFTDEEWLVHVGSAGGFDHYGALAERVGTGLPGRETLSARVAREEAASLAELAVMAGVTTWLEAARALGLGVAVASSSTEEIVRNRLEQTGLTDHFEIVVGRGPLLRAKPAPDVYIEACRRLGVLPARALAVEDSPNGLAAASAAGMRCLVVPNDATAAAIFEGAALTTTGLDVLSLADALVHLATLV